MVKTIWVLVEIENDQPARSSLEVLGKAASLGRAEAIVLGSQAAQVATGLGEYGAEKVYVHSDQAYDTLTVRFLAACADYDIDVRSGRIVRGDRSVEQFAAERCHCIL